MSVVLGLMTTCVLVGTRAADVAPGDVDAVDAVDAGGPAWPGSKGAGDGVVLAPGGGAGATGGGAPGAAPGAGGLAGGALGGAPGGGAGAGAGVGAGTTPPGAGAPGVSTTGG